MEAKSLLRDSAHFRHICIFPDKPKWQRVHKANIRLLVNTLGTDKIFAKSNRIRLKDDEINGNMEAIIEVVIQLIHEVKVEVRSWFTKFVWSRLWTSSSGSMNILDNKVRAIP